MCKEVLDGIRIYFDFILTDHLLYKSEFGQVHTGTAVNSVANTIKLEILNKNNGTLLDFINNHTQEVHADDCNQNEAESVTRRRTLRSYKSVDCQSNGNITAPLENSIILKPCSR